MEREISEMKFLFFLDDMVYIPYNVGKGRGI